MSIFQKAGPSRRHMLASSVGLAGLSFISGNAFATPAASMISASINAAQTRPVISPLIYGGFVEHIGNLMNHCFWAELLDDRKFFYPVLEAPEPRPAQPNFRRQFINKWHKASPDTNVSMMRAGAYVGTHSPVIALAADKDTGIKQIGINLRAGQSYDLRVVAKADQIGSFTASLGWATGDQATAVDIAIPVGPEWSSQTVRFTAGENTENGSLVISGKGAGSLSIGATSLMPKDNVEGFRPEILAAMKEMDCKILRMPGGNFISAYDWKDTVGPQDLRPPIEDPVWNFAQPNDLGVDELLRFCELIGVIPYWCVNTGFGEPRSGAELVEYVNGSATSEWGAKRALNGRAAPYNVHYWNIGNEMYGHWQFGHMNIEQYAIKHNLFARAMRAVDPSIYIVAPGGLLDEMTTGQGIPYPDAIEVEPGSNRDWAGGMLARSWDHFDALAAHAYPPDGQRFDMHLGRNVPVETSLLEWARMPANRVLTMHESWEVYQQRFPNLASSGKKIFFDEWAYHFQPDLKGALAIAMCLHEFYRHTDYIDMAAFTMGTAWLDFNRYSATISVSGRIFQLYNQHFGTVPVQVDGQNPLPAPTWPIGGDQPRVNAGSATYPLEVSAALKADGSALVVAVVNATQEAHQISLDFSGFNKAASGVARTLTGPNLGAQNKVGQSPEVTIVAASFDTNGPLNMAPISVTLFEFPLAAAAPTRPATRVPRRTRRGG